MNDFDPKESLLRTLDNFNIKVTSHKEKMVFVDMGYAIEIEGKGLFRLSHENQVIAPFDDLEELCNFIKMDMQLNEKD